MTTLRSNLRRKSITMTSVELDLDSSGGLMPKIQALIAPPESDDTSKANKKKEGLELHPYYKRPGKGHNRDCCDACSEGGNLICCDKCPASFHLACHDPPLDDDDIPLGQWLCHKCRVTAGLPLLKEIRAERNKATETENVSNTSDVPPKGESASETPTRGRSRTSSTASMESNKSRGRGRKAAAAAAIAPATSGPISTASVGAGPDRQSALETLIAAASSMNPRQFDLPREMVLPINFPGTDRAPTRGRKASAAKRSRTHELENGLVPLPAKTCFECRKSCKRAPLLACDYCPLLFHLDCLDPPLTSLPCGRWMCPNHVEQAIDEKLLTSLSVTQRVALWDKYTGPIDHDAVKTEFLQKARRQNPPFRFKVKLAPRNKAKVPNAVKEMYKNRMPLIPTLRDVLRDNEVTARLSEQPSTLKSDDTDMKVDGPTETEQEEWLSSIVALQTSIACHLGSRKRKKSESSDHSKNLTSDIKNEVLSEKSEEDETEIKEEFSSHFQDDSCSTKGNYIRNGSLDDGEQTSFDDEDAEVSKYTAKDRLNGPASKKIISKEEPHFKIQNGASDAIEEDVCDLLLISDEIGKPSQGEKDKMKFKRLRTNRSLVEGLSTILQDSLDCSVPTNVVDKLDERLVRLLALQRLQQLTGGARPVSDDLQLPLLSQTTVSSKQTTFWPSPKSGLQPRALLTPLNGSQPPMPIYYRVMEIGTGGDMDVCLSYYGHCNYITAKHAVIICDEVNRHYELMNYSEHGTTVDNVLYSCDFSEKTAVKCPPQSPSQNTQHHGRRSGGSSNTGNNLETSDVEVEVPPLIQKIRAVVDKRRGVHREEDNMPEPSTMPADIGKVDMKCSCRSSSSSVIGGSGAGWEGTALLNHGSFIKFGCIQFTFSVLNYVAPPSRETTFQERIAIGTLEKGPIPHRILKRERDSSSSSTLTVSPSPPPDTPSQMPRCPRSRRSRKLEDEEEKDEVNDESDRDDNEEDYDENILEETTEIVGEPMDVQEDPNGDERPQSHHIESSSSTDCI